MASEISKNDQEYHVGTKEFASRQGETHSRPEDNAPRAQAPSARKNREKKRHSRLLRHFAVPALLLIAYIYLSQPAAAPEQHWEEEVYYTVVYGDTLWDISARYLGTVYGYHQIAKENHIPNYDLIFPGQVIKITVRH